MKESMIKNWHQVDPLSFYAEHLRTHSLVYSRADDLWVGYSFDVCQQLFQHPDIVIPQPLIPPGCQPANNVLLLLSKIARISNGEEHRIARQAAMALYDHASRVDVKAVLQTLIKTITPGVADETAFDWVASVSKKLPVMILLKGLNFSDNDTAWVTENLPSLARLTSPEKTASDIIAINKLVEGFFEIVNRQVCLPIITQSIDRDLPHQAKGGTPGLVACNLLGLFIQCYDAGRGLLTNIVRQMAKLSLQTFGKTDRFYLSKIVTEVLRYDPPVHHTRRIAKVDIQIDDHLIRAGQHIVIMMAAANLDEKIFENPMDFNPQRSNNSMHLSFGTGGHACLAKHMVIDMAVETLAWLLDDYRIGIPEQPTAFEPTINARHPKSMYITLSRRFKIQ